MGQYLSKLDCIAIAASGAAATKLHDKLLEFVGVFATEALLKAVPLAERIDGSLGIVSSGPSLWVYSATSTATASASVLEPDDGIGRWLASGGGAGGAGAGVFATRVATAAALPANTRTANVLTASANASINTTGIDGLTNLVVGQLVLVKNEVTQANNGVYVIDDLGSASTPWIMTRASFMDSSDDLVPGMVIVASEGTANADTAFVLSSDATLTLNTSALAFLQIPSLADLASTATGQGASMIGIEDAGGIITGTTVETALAENRTAIDVAEAAIVAVNAEVDVLRPGAPMFNRLRLLGAPGAAVEGNTVTVGADVYEFRGSTPPAGGTAGRIWVYNGADSAASRANLINAINGVVDAPTITRDGTNTENVVASAGVTTGDVVVQSADNIGGAVVPSAAAIAFAETLATATDVWDQANSYGGLALQARQMITASITLSADMIAKGTLEFFLDFTPITAIVMNRSRPQNEAYTIVGDAVSLTLAGGASPNNQAGDVVDIVAFA